MRLRVTPVDGVVVVVPSGFDLRRVPAFVEEHRGWVEKALEEVGAQPGGGVDPSSRPERIAVAAIDRVWDLEWHPTDSSHIAIEEGPFRLRISGPIEEAGLWREALRRWLIERGREHLPGWVEEMSALLRLRVDRITIRCQRTRWGSYTARPGRDGTISLNAQLLFLSHRLVRYVILHELCHAVHPNHSPAFWALMRTHEPESDRLRSELRSAHRQVPRWVLARSSSEPRGAS